MAKEVEDAEKEMRAAKARLRRLCETKSNGKLKVPAWLHEAWKSGDKGAMAEAYKQTGYDKDFGECFRCFLNIRTCLNMSFSSFPQHPCT